MSSLYLDNITQKSFHSLPDGITPELIAAANEGNSNAQLVASLRFAGYHQLADTVNKCCIEAISSRSIIQIVSTDDRSRFHRGLKKCRRHLCPYCGHERAGWRLDELTKKAEEIASAGINTHYFATLTTPPGDNLRKQFHGITAAFKAARQRREWNKSVAGFIRAFDVTYDINHHLHLHCIITMKDNANEQFFDWLQRMWEQEILKGLGLQCGPDAVHIAPVAHLGKTITYITRAKAVAEPSEEIDGETDREAPWHMPAAAFAELWKASHGVHWFNCGGIWKSKKVKGIRQHKNANITIAANKWQALPRDARQLINKHITRSGIVSTKAILSNAGLIA